MSTSLTLQQTSASGPLLPATLAQALAALARRGEAPRGSMRGQVMRLVGSLSLDDDACAAFTLDFIAQGDRVRGAAHGPSTALFTWAFHALAKSLKCTLRGDDGAEVAVAPEAHVEGARAYLATYEADVRATRGARAEDDAAPFVAWLAREEHVALVDGAEDAAFASLPMNDPPALYEELLESDAVDDVFVSESELATLLARFRARKSKG